MTADPSVARGERTVRTVLGEKTVRSGEVSAGVEEEMIDGLVYKTTTLLPYHNSTHYLHACSINILHLMALIVV